MMSTILSTEAQISVSQFSLASGFCFLIYLFLIHPSFVTPLSKIPKAHWSVPFSSLWILLIRFNKRENATLQKAHERLGPVIRVGPNDISVNDIHYVRTIYGGGYEKTSWYSVFDNYGYEHSPQTPRLLIEKLIISSVPCMFSARGTREHTARKRMISHVYSKSAIQSSETSKAQAHSILFKRLMPILKESTLAHQKPHGIDVHSLFLATTMDFISAYVFGIQSSTNFLQDVAYREHWLQLYKCRNDHGFFPQELPWVTRFLRKIWLQPYPTWVDAANKELGEWNTKMCMASLDLCSKLQAKTSHADEPVVLRNLLSGFHKEEVENGKESALFSTAIRHHDLSVQSELFDHVLAGQETAGVALTYATWHLSQRSDLQRRLSTELRRLGPSMVVNSSNDGNLADPKAIDALPILHAIVMETLRLHAPLPGPQPRQTPYPSCKIGSYTIPGGVRIAALAHTLHRDQNVFPYPEEWDHTRWLVDNASAEMLKERNRQFWAFSSGGRMCIGSNFAMHGESPRAPDYL